MKVFVAFGYNDRDKWIPEMVFPILTAFGIDVVTGENMAGESIPQKVRDKIKNSDGLLAFLTRRDDLGNGTYNTHKWVTDEVAVAIGANRKVIEVREDGLASFSGITDDRQFLKYNEGERDKFLVELVTAISGWAGATSSLRIRLLPSEFCNAVQPLLLQGENVECEYHYLIGNEKTKSYSGSLLSFNAAVVIDVDTSDLPSRRDNVFIQVHARHRNSGGKWNSVYEQLNLLSVTMR